MNTLASGALAAVSLLTLVFQAGPPDAGETLGRARTVLQSSSEGRGTVELTLAGFPGRPPMRGTYAFSSGGRFRMEVDGYDFKTVLVENGRDFWQVYQKDNASMAIRLKTGTFTAEEYDLARWIGGYGGMPLLSLPQILTLLEKSKPAHVATEGRTGAPEDVFEAGIPARQGQMAKIMLAFQTEIAGGDPPDSLWISIQRKDGQISRIRGVDGAGKVLSELVFLKQTFGKITDSNVFQFSPPEGLAIVNAESLMMLHEGGLAWLEGRKLPDISVETADARVVRPVSRGRPFVMNFWATWCGPCLIEWPVLQQLFEKYKKDADFYLVASEPVPEVQSFVKKNGYTVPVHFEGRSGASAHLAVGNIPTTLFVSAEGIVSSVHIGFGRHPTLEKTRAALFDKYDRILRDLVLNSGSKLQPAATSGRKGKG